MTDMENFEKKEQYRKKIIGLVEKIDNQDVLKKIHTVVKTHLEILQEKGQGD